MELELRCLKSQSGVAKGMVLLYASEQVQMAICVRTVHPHCAKVGKVMTEVMCGQFGGGVGQGAGGQGWFERGAPVHTLQWNEYSCTPTDCINCTPNLMTMRINLLLKKKCNADKNCVSYCHADTIVVCLLFHFVHFGLSNPRSSLLIQ